MTFSTPAGRLRLSPVLDCFDGAIVSWTASRSPDSEMANSMPGAALETVGEGDRGFLIVHSDRGCRYRWPDWLDTCREAASSARCRARAAARTTRGWKGGSRHDEGGDARARGLVSRHARRPRGGDTLVYRVAQLSAQEALARESEPHGVPENDGPGGLRSSVARYGFPLPPPSDHLILHINSLCRMCWRGERAAGCRWGRACRAGGTRGGTSHQNVARPLAGVLQR